MAEAYLQKYSLLLEVEGSLVAAVLVIKCFCSFPELLYISCRENGPRSILGIRTLGPQRDVFCILLTSPELEIG
jgi:hypothetical protein